MADGCTHLQWHAIDDGELCGTCPTRFGKVWLFDGTPVDHDLPFAEPPIHDDCRCILLALSP